VPVFCLGAELYVSQVQTVVALPLAALQVPDADIEPVTDLPSLAGMASPNGETQVKIATGLVSVVWQKTDWCSVAFAHQEMPVLNGSSGNWTNK
jgi:hypothetical protein